MNKTLKELFVENKSYILDIKLGKDFSIYIEGLDNLGLGIYDLNYPVEDIEYFCVELIFENEFVKNISNHKITLNTTVEEIKKLGIEQLRKGYKAFTGLDNGNEFTDEELLEYMRVVLREESFENEE